jgi:hypothetical protein
MDSNTVLMVILGVLIIATAVWVYMGSRKRQWYKVYLANNDVMLLYRDLNERWWRTNGTYMRFKNEYGKEVTFLSNAHWVLMMEEVPLSELNVAKEEVRRIKLSQSGDK